MTATLTASRIDTTARTAALWGPGIAVAVAADHALAAAIVIPVVAARLR